MRARLRASVPLAIGLPWKMKGTYIGSNTLQAPLVVPNLIRDLGPDRGVVGQSIGIIRHVRQCKAPAISKILRPVGVGVVRWHRSVFVADGTSVIG